MEAVLVIAAVALGLVATLVVVLGMSGVSACETDLAG